MYKVFVYGSLKLGFWNNERFLSNSDYLGDSETAEHCYDMVSFTSFPGVVEGGKYGICGEVYEVDDYTLARLDLLEGNGHFYVRKLVELTSGDEAWMYVLCGGITRRMLTAWDSDVPAEESTNTAAGVTPLETEEKGICLNWTGD